MKTLTRMTVLAALLLGASATSRAAARPSEEVRRYAYADRALDAVAAKIGEVKHCISLLQSMKDSLSAKKSEIAAENNGAIPDAYSDIISLRETRIATLRTTCFTLNKELTPLFDDAHTQIRGIEPPSSAGVPKRRERFYSLRATANSLSKALR